MCSCRSDSASSCAGGGASETPPCTSANRRRKMKKPGTSPGLFVLLSFTNLSAGNNVNVGVFLGVTGLLALTGRFAPHSFCAAEPPALLAFTSTVRVVYRVHRTTTDSRADTLPAASACFTVVLETMVFV